MIQPRPCTSLGILFQECITVLRTSSRPILVEERVVPLQSRQDISGRFVHKTVPFDVDLPLEDIGIMLLHQQSTLPSCNVHAFLLFETRNGANFHSSGVFVMSCFER
jgi:hypothetical protein